MPEELGPRPGTARARRRLELETMGTECHDCLLPQEIVSLMHPDRALVT